ncbi:polyphosphate polymerase domain-containing protein [Oscillospiraceae bacterium PP1C4]
MKLRGDFLVNEVLRQEHKFLITTLEYIKYSHHFANFLKEDTHNGIDGYTVRSLYFDTLENKDYKEKNDGLEIRKKIRLRIYDPNSDFAVLEMKQKQGIDQRKRSLRISRQDAISLTKGIYTPLLKYKDPFSVECFTVMSMQFYRPKTVIQYNRKAFIAKENKIRVTFDNRLVATESCFDIFSNKLNFYPVFDPYNVVLEVKYNGFLLSYIREIINECNRSNLSVSKYCVSRSVSMNYIF